MLGADLSKGFETFDKHDDSVDEHLDGLLRTIANHEQETKQKIDAHVVTWRGVMTKVTLLAESWLFQLRWRSEKLTSTAQDYDDPV